MRSENIFKTKASSSVSEGKIDRILPVFVVEVPRPLTAVSTPSSAGSFKRPLFADDGTTCIGIETEDGTRYLGEKVVLAAGAWSPTLVDLEDQCCSKVST